MDPFDISVFGAMVAGFLTFVSPCILPIVPAYLCFLGGASLDQLITEDGVDKAVSRRVFYSAIAFVLGFGSVFVAMGAGATAIGQLLQEHMDVFRIVAGIVIVLFGLHFMGIFRIGFLNFEKRLHVENAPSGMVGSYVLGLAFAAGWSPCAGPILGTILMMAAAEDSVGQGILLLTSYAAGIGIPFLIAAAFVKPLMGFMGKFRRHMHKVEITVGVLLILTGIAISTNMLMYVSSWMLEFMPQLNT